MGSGATITTGRRSRVVSWRAKLRPSQVRAVRRLWQEGWSQERIRLKLRLPVSQTALSMLVRGVTYRGVV